MSSNFAFAKTPAPPTGTGFGAVRVYSTCPSSLTESDDYVRKITEASRWSEMAGYAGMLVYNDNSLADPWLVSQIIIRSTRALCPLVAVQPVYMHPYSVARMVATLGLLHGRRVFLNMVAGGFRNDLAALNDVTPHDNRYDRLVEYTKIVQELLNRRSPLTFAGKYYRVTNLTLRPRLSAELHPGILMSGSTDAGMAAAREIGAVAIRYPDPAATQKPVAPDGARCGVRIGVIARPRENEAWAAALERFPDDRKSAIGGHETYWLHPLENYQTNCPYLVGSYDSVAGHLTRYISLGFHTFILDIPAAEEEFFHTGAAFQAAARGAGL